MNALYRELDESQQKMLRGPGDETICGYPIRDLVIFADACRVAGVGPKELKDFVEEEFASLRDGVEGGKG